MEVNELSLDNIVGSSYDMYDASGAEDEEVDTEEVYDGSENDKKEEEQDKNNNVTEETESEEKEDNDPESVGDEVEIDEDAASLESDGDSSASQFYSSIANALREDGIFENLDDSDFGDISDADDFRALIEKEVDGRLSASEKNIKEALESGIKPDDIVKYQNMVSYLESISEDNLTDESADGELLRKRLIFQDYINKGFTQEKALKEVDKSVAAGTDIDDAKDALEENLKFYKDAYTDEINQRKAAEKAQRDAVLKQTEELKELIFNEKEVFEGIKLDKNTRNKIFDVISKPSVKGEDGNRYTELQDYQRKHPNDFIHKLGVLYVLTDGFKNIDKLVRSKVIKKQNESIKNLERALKNQNVNYGEPRYVSNGITRDTNKKSRYSLL